MNFQNKLSKKGMMICALVIIFNVSSCKYEDGPAISLRSKKNRLSGEWKAVKIDGETPDSDLTIEFDKEGDFSYSYEYSYYGYTIPVKAEGTWEWGDKKESIEIELKYDGETEKLEWDVLRLTNKELWLEDDGDKIELEKE